MKKLLLSLGCIVACSCSFSELAASNKLGITLGEQTLSPEQLAAPRQEAVDALSNICGGKSTQEGLDSLKSIEPALKQLVLYHLAAGSNDKCSAKIVKLYSRVAKLLAVAEKPDAGKKGKKAKELAKETKEIKKKVAKILSCCHKAKPATKAEPKPAEPANVEPVSEPKVEPAVAAPTNVEPVADPVEEPAVSAA
ncbi:MAG: hypothetical protein LBQ43_02230 [Holosporales bacterium]|nr:hypothetical protein [Holosporales bacterium]